MRKIPICFAIAIMFCISFASAGMFESKSYDERNQIVTVDKAFLGIKLPTFLGGGEVANIKLDTPLINFVLAGEEVLVANLTVSSYTDYESALEEIEFYDVNRNMEKQTKTYKYKVRSVEDYIRKDANGTHNLQREVWTEIEEGFIPKGNITIGIFTKVNPGDTVEWIPNMFGVRIQEWAIYTTGVLENTGFVQQGTDAGQTGVRGVSYNVSTGAQIYIVNASKVVGTTCDTATLVANSTMLWVANATFSGLTATFDYQAVPGERYHVVARPSAGSCTFSWTNAPPSYPIAGQYGNFTNSINANFQLSTANMWVFTSVGVAEYADGVVNVTHPVNNSNYSSTLNEPVNATILGVDSAVNSTFRLLHINGTPIGINFTTLSNTNNTNFTLPNLPDGSYFFNIEMCSVDECPTSSNFTFNVDSSVPSITLNNPRNISFSTIPAILEYNYTIVDSTLAFCSYITNENLTLTLVPCNSVFNITFQQYGSKTVNFTANDTLGNSATHMSVFQLVSENSQTFNSIITEGSIQNFQLNISYNSTNLSSPSAVLFYNGTPYAGALTGVGDTIAFSRSITVPIVDSDTNIDFYWNVTFGTRTFQSTINQQTIQNAQIIECTNSSAIFSFTVVDEESQEIIPNATMEWAFQFRNIDGQIVLTQNISTSVNPNGVCSTVPLPGDSFLIDGTIKYFNETHAIEYYEIRDYTWEGNYTTENITLYDLLLADSTDFQITFNGLDFLPDPNVILYLERQYLQEGTFKVVEAPITDSNGQTILHMVQNDIYYNIKAVKDGEILGIYSNIRAFCQDTLGTCTITLTATQTDIFTPDYNSITNTGILFVGSPTLNTTTQIVSVSFVSVDSEQKNVTIKINRNDIFGNETLCTNSINAVSGTVTCQLDPLFSETSVITNIYVDGQLAVLEPTEGQSLGFGSIGYFAWFVATLVLILIFADNKNMVIAMMMVSYIGAVFLGLTVGKIIGLGTGLGSAGIWIIAITVVALYQLNKRRVE